MFSKLIGPNLEIFLANRKCPPSHYPPLQSGSRSETIEVNGTPLSGNLVRLLVGGGGPVCRG